MSNPPLATLTELWQDLSLSGRISYVHPGKTFDGGTVVATAAEYGIHCIGAISPLGYQGHQRMQRDGCSATVMSRVQATSCQACVYSTLISATFSTLAGSPEVVMIDSVAYAALGQYTMHQLARVTTIGLKLLGFV